MVTVAVDFDNVLAYTSRERCTWHNKTYQFDVPLSEYLHFQQHRVRSWGDKPTADTRSAEFDATEEAKVVAPIETASAGLSALKLAGHRLVLVTAREVEQADYTCDWLEKHLPNLFDEIYLTPEDANAETPKADSGKDLRYQVLPGPKSQVCRKIKASVLVDDSVENAYEVHKAAGIAAAVFGDWPWNKFEPDEEAAASPMSWEQRREANMNDDDREPAKLPEGVYRALTWNDVVEVVRKIASVKTAV